MDDLALRWDFASGMISDSCRFFFILCLMRRHFLCVNAWHFEMHFVLPFCILVTDCQRAFAPRRNVVKQHLSWEEIKKRYPNEWVVLIDLDADDETDEVFGGVVFDHGVDRRSVHTRNKGQLAGSSIAILFTGDVGKGIYLF